MLAEHMVLREHMILSREFNVVGLNWLRLELKKVVRKKELEELESLCRSTFSGNGSCV